VLELGANNQGAGSSKQGPFIINTSFPGLPWLCVLFPAPQGARGGARAGPGMGLGYYQGARPPPSGPFRGKGPGPGGGGSRLNSLSGFAARVGVWATCGRFGGRPGRKKRRTTRTRPPPAYRPTHPHPYPEAHPGCTGCRAHPGCTEVIATHAKRDVGRPARFEKVMGLPVTPVAFTGDYEEVALGWYFFARATKVKVQSLSGDRSAVAAIFDASMAHDGKSALNPLLSSAGGARSARAARSMPGAPLLGFSHAMGEEVIPAARLTLRVVLAVQVYCIEGAAATAAQSMGAAGARRGHQRHCHVPVALPWQMKKKDVVASPWDLQPPFLYVCSPSLSPPCICCSIGTLV
jgi:hypothetical protein